MTKLYTKKVDKCYACPNYYHPRGVTYGACSVKDKPVRRPQAIPHWCPLIEVGCPLPDSKEWGLSCLT